MTYSAAKLGSVDNIPIRNLWLLMLYASHLYRELPSHQRVAIEEAPDDIPNLVAEILARAVDRRLRRNLSSDFRYTQADLTRVRGRIDLLRTERRSLLDQGKVACTFDELTTDTPSNRFVKAALKRLSKTVLDSQLGNRCLTAVVALERLGVRDDKSRRIVPKKVGPPWTTRRNCSEDQQMLAAATLAFDLAIPTESRGSSLPPAPGRDIVWARRLFESAIGGFYDVVLSQNGWAVRVAKRMDWQLECPTPGMKAILPSMQTDIILERIIAQEQAKPSRTIIDTKFNRILKRNRFGGFSLRSGYIYQMYAYLRSQERYSDPLSMNSIGMLLHPSVDGEVDEAATFQGHRIRFVTVNLAADSKAIRQRLLALVGYGTSRSPN